MPGSGGSPGPSPNLLGNEERASAAFNARVIPIAASTDPEVACVGLTEAQTKRLF